ncbi:MAG TPA: ribonuclease HI [Chitinophagales bacterium]|jgi:ribonuclease HI|nr:ribonuclease HI [Chitinophagales bacterium]MBP6154811.1 ribonuclease HI [Chitinophagales bacterium]HQV77408.1 ribonuclease HI [Chitinophagales bacterium]HQW78470.1 ribonuclease HI [Chitinophagales bacterium]HRB66918.1 ribonuclease HI [Chitinophagales bacterium]
MVEIYTDGSSRGNPGPGGYGVVLLAQGHRKELSKGFRHTTNNRMELLAVIAGLEALKKQDLEISIYSDSKYVVESVEKGWVFQWNMKEDFAKKKNRDLWKRFLKLYEYQNITFIWIKGHSTNKENNRCDILATEAADSFELAIDEVYENEVKNKNGLF